MPTQHSQKTSSGKCLLFALSNFFNLLKKLLNIFINSLQLAEANCSVSAALTHLPDNTFIRRGFGKI